MISNQVYLGLGSNIGDRLDHIQKAVFLLSKLFKKIQVSSLYQTQPIGPEQEDFYNLVFWGETHIKAEELLENTQCIEKEIGRTATFFWGPRVIDIDLIFFNQEAIKTEKLIIPHPEITKRRFVLEPLLEIAGNLPINNRRLFYYLNQTIGQRCEKIQLDRHILFHS